MKYIVKRLWALLLFRRKIRYLRSSAKTGGEVNHVVVIYRISDCGYPKQKPEYIGNENCLRNAVSQFPVGVCDWHVIADNISESTFGVICKYVPENAVERVSVGQGAGAFRLAYEHALQYGDGDCIYFLENDYLHFEGALSVLKEGLSLGEGEYVTLYDHPDKYGYGAEKNPVVFGGEKTKVFLSPSSHWKITNSTTMTFAARVKTLREDKKPFWRWTSTRHPFDFYIFCELGFLKGRRLLSPLPGYSTHGEREFLSPLRKWETTL